MNGPALIAGTPLPDHDHVLRYIGKRHVDNGVVNGSGFFIRPTEDLPSVNWMECFPPPIDNQVAEIKARRRLRYEKNALLVRLNVGATKQYLSLSSTTTVEVDFILDPLPAENGRPEDPSHAVIKGVPVVDTPEENSSKTFHELHS